MDAIAVYLSKNLVQVQIGSREKSSVGEEGRELCRGGWDVTSESMGPPKPFFDEWNLLSVFDWKWKKRTWQMCQP